MRDEVVDMSRGHDPLETERVVRADRSHHPGSLDDADLHLLVPVDHARQGV